MERDRNGRRVARSVALYGMLVALAFIFSYVEAMVPVPLPIPWDQAGACQSGDDCGALYRGDSGGGGGIADPGFCSWGLRLGMYSVWRIVWREGSSAWL